MWELYFGDSGTTSTTSSCGATYYIYTTTSTTGTYTSNVTSQYQGAASNYYAGRHNSQASNWDGYASREWLAEQRRKQAAQLESHASEAKERARGLLLENLSADQRKTFKKNGWFVVEGGQSKKRYRIGSKEGHVAANVEVLDGERTSHRLCGHFDVSKAPLGDHLLAQKLMIEHAEDDFIRIANRHAA